MQSDCDKPYTPRKLNFYFTNAETVDHFTRWWLTKWARERTDTFLFGSVQATVLLFSTVDTVSSAPAESMMGLFYFPKHNITKTFYR